MARLTRERGTTIYLGKKRKKAARTPFGSQEEKRGKSLTSRGGRRRSHTVRQERGQQAIFFTKGRERKVYFCRPREKKGGES